MLGLVQNVHVLHYARENESIAQKRALRDSYSLSLVCAVLRPFLQSTHKCVYLEGEAPSFRVFVVYFQKIHVLVGSNVLPVTQWFIEDN